MNISRIVMLILFVLLLLSPVSALGMLKVEVTPKDLTVERVVIDENETVRYNVTVISVPEMSVSPKNFETDIYQGSKAKFGIVIEETTGLAPLENVSLRVSNCCSGRVGKCTLTFITLPEDWISFNKNNFDVPAGESVTVYCTINVPENAEPKSYFGLISVNTENNGCTFINITANVLKDTIPPEIVVYFPKDGEVVYEPYVTIKGVARDNTGIKSLKISREEWIKPLATGIEREAYMEVPFEQEMQLEKGWNYFTIEAEDLAGNKASKTISVKYEPIIVTPATISTITVSPHITSTPTHTSITQVPTPTPVPVSPGKEVVSEIKPLKVVYYVDVDKQTRELIINITIENVGKDTLKDVYVQMETPNVLQRTLVLNAVEKPNGLYIGDLSPQESKTLTQRFKVTGKVEGDLRIPVTIKASAGSDLQTILVIIIVISEALLKLLQYGVIPGFEVTVAIAALAFALRKIKR